MNGESDNQKRLPEEVVVTLKDQGKGDKDKFPLEKWKVIISGFASIAIPVVILIVGKMIDTSIKEQELSVKYIEMAVNILSQPISPETKNLRKWAVQNIKEYSRVELDPDTEKEMNIESFPTREAEAVSSVKNFTTPVLPRKIEYVVITDTEAPTLQSTLNAISRPNASASYHYLIGTDGRIEKVIDEENIAWFAGRSEWEGKTNLNDISVGIGLVHLATPDGKNWLNLPGDHPAIGPDYTKAQLDALVNLLADVTRRNHLDSSRIITKQDIAPDRRRTDLFGKGIEDIRDRVAKLRAGN